MSWIIEFFAIHGKVTEAILTETPIGGVQSEALRGLAP